MQKQPKPQTVLVFRQIKTTTDDTVLSVHFDVEGSYNEPGYTSWYHHEHAASRWYENLILSTYVLRDSKYRPVWTLAYTSEFSTEYKIKDVQAMAKTLDAITRKLAKLERSLGGVTDFPHMVARLAFAVGIKKIYMPDQDRKMTCAAIGDGVYSIRDILRDLTKQHGAVDAA